MPAESRELTLTGFRDRYLATHRDSLEDRTIEGIGLHFKHLVAALGERFPIRELKLADLQGYVDRRAKAKGMSGKTAEFRHHQEGDRHTADGMELGARKWGWSPAAFPITDCVTQEHSEKPPFQTIDEIERRIKAGGITTAQRKELWESLYLRTPEIAELLVYAKEHAAHPWIFPMICMAAHTGARRSELTRMLITDVDFEGGSVTIREKKRVKGKDSTRRAPLTTVLREALQAWLSVHPGGNTLFCHAGPVERSRKRSRTTGHQSGKGRAKTLAERLATVHERQDRPEAGPLTPRELHDHFRRTLRGGKWKVVRGLHVLRHSVASCLAAAGVDQRIIDDILGHQSLEMQRRYRHLTPQVKSQAVLAVFG